MNQNVNQTLFRQDQNGNFYWYKNDNFLIENPTNSNSNSNSSNVSYAVDTISNEGRVYFKPEQINRENSILNFQREFNRFVVRFNDIIRYRDEIYPRSLPANLGKELDEIGDEIGVDFSRPLHLMEQMTRDDAQQVYDAEPRSDDNN